MPSISKAELDDLRSALKDQTDVANAQQRAAVAAEMKVRQFDSVLDKIVRAADGRPLTDNSAGSYGAYGNPYAGSLQSGEPLRKIKTEERQAQEIRDLNERIVYLEARLAAAKAVATFARAHKA